MRTKIIYALTLVLVVVLMAAPMALSDAHDPPTRSEFDALADRVAVLEGLHDIAPSPSPSPTETMSPTPEPSPTETTSPSPEPSPSPTTDLETLYTPRDACDNATTVPVGQTDQAYQIEPLGFVGCFDLRPAPPASAVSGPNSWVDEFNVCGSFPCHTMAEFNDGDLGYRVFDSHGWATTSKHWFNQDHWMVDLDYSGIPSDWAARGMGMIRPDRTFTFEDGRLVVETVVAAGIPEYDSPLWPEVVITTGDRPWNINGNYTYSMFPEDVTFGCRLQSSRYPVCALRDDNGSEATLRKSTRLYEISAFQEGGTTNFGGSPFQGRENLWNRCEVGGPDVPCRDTFRFEWTATTFSLYVNGGLYFEQTGLPALPDSLLNGDVHVYFSSVIVGNTTPSLARFHWDRIAVNP